MNNADRRSSPRYMMQMPIRFRESDSNKEPEGYTGETTNISRTGVFFVTRIPLELGSSLQLSLRVPRELSGSAKSEVQCVGRMVRMECWPDGSIGYGTRIDLRQTAGALAVVRETVEAVGFGAGVGRRDMNFVLAASVSG